MEASHLGDIGNRSEGLLKQTQYPKTSQLPLLMNYAENTAVGISPADFNE